MKSVIYIAGPMACGVVLLFTGGTHRMAAQTAASGTNSWTWIGFWKTSNQQVLTADEQQG